MTEHVAIEVNEATRTLYLYLQPERAGLLKGVVARTERIRRDNPTINVDYDAEGRVYGVEVLW